MRAKPRPFAAGPGTRGLTVAAVVAAALAALAVAAGAQEPPRVARVGLLSAFSSDATRGWHQAFRQGLRDLGWVEGRNLHIEARYADGRSERLGALAGDLVRLKVDVIVTAVTPDALAAKKATSTIPIVMASAGDPVATGLVASLARPGGNLTGLSQVAPELAGKRLDLLTQLVPGLGRVAVMWNPEGQSSALSWQEIQAPARKLGVQLHSVRVRTAEALPGAFDEAVRARAGAVAILPSPLFVTNLRRTAALALDRRLPSIFHLTEYVDTGGMAAYGPDRSDLFRRAALYVDRILKGARAADLPIEQPTKFELAINLKTARALGLSIPQAVLLRADHVVQ